MKSIGSKLITGFLTFILGLSLSWASSNFQFLNSHFIMSESPRAENKGLGGEPSLREKSGKVQLHFKSFEQAKDWIAHFEIVNDTAKPILYVGHRRKDNFDFCNVAAKRHEQFERSGYATRYMCRYTSYIALQTIEPGESRQFSIYDQEVRDMFNLPASEAKVNAQIGFEFFAGDERRKEMLWSEEITFPSNHSSN